METTKERESAQRLLLGRLSAELAEKTRARNLAAWELATTGSAEASDALAKASVALDRVLGNPETYLSVRRFAHDQPTTDPALDRALSLLEKQMAARQGNNATRQDIAAREAELRRAYGTFRPEIGGAAHSAGEIQKILAASNDVELRREAWEASKQVGAEVREQVVELVELRNEVARELGHRDHYAMSLELSELSEERLFATLGKLEKATRTPFRTRKAVHDAELSRRFDTSVGELRPWHYANPYFQSVGVPSSLKLDAHYAGRDLVELATRFFDGIGMNVRPVLERSDLEPRPGKDEHAFSMCVDRETKDVRILTNLVPSERWMQTLLHELGHAAYERYIDQPWLLCRPAHALMTEAVALLVGRQSVDLEFLLEYLGLPAFEVTPLSGEIRRFQCFRMQAFTRFVLVMTHFERELYADPRRADLDALWWELKKKYQLLECPDGREAPDWAAKRHLALTPVYYQNYIYGELVASQLRHVIIEKARTNSIVDSLFAGEFLIQEVFGHGASRRWDLLVEQATGEPLDPQYFVREFTT